MSTITMSSDLILLLASFVTYSMYSYIYAVGLDLENAVHHI